MIDEVEVESAEGGSDGVSSEGEKAPVAERIQVTFLLKTHVVSEVCFL